MSERFELTDLDDLWYHKLRPSMSSGPLRSIARFAFGILKDSVRLALEGETQFPAENRGYVLEKVICIIERTALQKDVMLEFAKYSSTEDLQALLKQAVSQQPDKGD